MLCEIGFDLIDAHAILLHGVAFADGDRGVAHGIAINGDAKGRELGFRTANIKLKPQILRPKYGVYKVRTNFGEGVANFGVRPTLDGKKELLEVHLFDFNKDIYGENMKVEFLSFIRPEKQFASLQELKNQIEEDINTAKAK